MAWRPGDPLEEDRQPVEASAPSSRVASPSAFLQPLPDRTLPRPWRCGRHSRRRMPPRPRTHPLPHRDPHAFSRASGRRSMSDRTSLLARHRRASLAQDRELQPKCGPRVRAGYQHWDARRLRLAGQAPVVDPANPRQPAPQGRDILCDVTSSYLEGQHCRLPSAIVATARRARCRSSSACSAPPTNVRSTSRCSPATSVIRLRW